MPRNIFQVTVNLPASFRNNINNNDLVNPYVFVRNRLYHFVFHRFALVYARILSDVHRKLIEFLILLASLFCFITLIYVHVVFVQTPMTCLDNYKDVWQRNGILRVEVLSSKSKENYTLQDSYWKEKTLRMQYFDGQSYYFYSEQTVKEESTVKDMSREEVIIIGNNVSMKGDILDDDVFDNSIFMESDDSKDSEEDSANDSEVEKVEDETTLQPILEESIIAADPGEAYIMEFSLEYGFLRLRPSKRRDLNISVTFVVLDPEVDECFGGSFNRFLLDNFLGYDNVLLASIKKMAEKKDQKGFVRNAVMDIEYIFINNWTHEKSYITAGFVMIIFTLTISTLLRHSHHQIFIVVGFWMHYVVATFGRPRVNMWPRNLLPSSGAPVLTVILALVGMEAVMSDFFHDRSIALYVIIIVWFADLYDAVCCQSALSKRHWFRFFYLYHFLFYAYNYKFGGVYWPLTLTTSFLFTLHSMVFFFHHYELPRFLHRAARMAAAHEAARNLRPHQNPPDNPPNQEPDNQRDGNPPDDDTGGHAALGRESTPELEIDQESASNEREGSVDRSDSTDQSGSTDLSGFNNGSDLTDLSGFSYQPYITGLSGLNNQSGLTGLSGSNNQLSSADQSSAKDKKESVKESGSADNSAATYSTGFANLCSSVYEIMPIDGSGTKDQYACTDLKVFMYQSNFVDESSSIDQSSTIHQFGSTDQSGCKNPFGSSVKHISSSTRNSYESIDTSTHNSRNAVMQYDPIDQMNQSKYIVQPMFMSLDRNLSIGKSSSTKKSISTDSFQTKGQGKCQVEYKEVSLVPKSSLLASHHGIMSHKMNAQCDERWGSSISNLPQGCTRLSKVFESHDELERFYKLAHNVFEKSQSSENVSVGFLKREVNRSFEGTFFPMSYLKKNSTYFQENMLCGMKQRFGVNVATC
ncbi:hypothetical protein JTE90_017108 [Oedothorax gibbosus]|uniref:Membralin n=1 Tax=Oedothorax gibbosus TaxID=931172 RepID=A0AAV6UF47_9ARAC|nr:hypothetical protein JTE90_017108 [Oedothorax gibbosus]